MERKALAGRTQRAGDSAKVLFKRCKSLRFFYNALLNERLLSRLPASIVKLGVIGTSGFFSFVTVSQTAGVTVPRPGVVYHIQGICAK